MISWDASRAAPVEVSASGNKDSGSSNEANGNHSESFVFKTTLFPEKHTLCLLLFQDVKNASAVRETLLAGNSPDFALINPDMIFSSFHLLLAASIALLHANQGTMRVKTLHAELLYSLSPTASISEAFRIFGGGGGAAPTKTDRLLFAFIDTPVPVIITQVFPLVQGRAVPAERVLSCLDARPMPVERAAAFREVFKVVGGREKGQERQGDKGGGREGEKEETELEHAIISHVAAKRVL